MIFFDCYNRAFSIPKVLAPLADCMKSYKRVLVADRKAFNKVVEEFKEKYNAVPKAEERFIFKVWEGPQAFIAVYKNSSNPMPIFSIGFTDVVGMFGFDTSQSSIQPVPDDGDEYYSLPEDIKNSVQKGGEK